jgi:hypothetical protein
MEELRPDLDEIRRELRPPRRGISTGSGIVLAAVILVTGYWGGKYIQDELEARRIQAALTDLGRALGLISQAPAPQIQEQGPQRAQTRYQDPTATSWKPNHKGTTVEALQQVQANQTERERQRRQEEARRANAQAEANRKRQAQIEAQRKAEIEAWNSVECRFWWQRQGWPAHKARELTACKPYVTMPH